MLNWRGFVFSLSMKLSLRKHWYESGVCIGTWLGVWLGLRKKFLAMVSLGVLVFYTCSFRVDGWLGWIWFILFSFLFGCLRDVMTGLLLLYWGFTIKCLFLVQLCNGGGVLLSRFLLDYPRYADCPWWGSNFFQYYGCFLVKNIDR